MAFQRAQWHSGLTYRQICDTCRTEVRYTDEVLDFRPWYPDGFVDCPKCGNHMRHNEKYAIIVSNNPIIEMAEQGISDFAELENFCNKCGTKYEVGDRFCSNCGNKRLNV